MAIAIGGGASLAALSRWVAVPALDRRYAAKETKGGHEFDKRYITKESHELRCGKTSAEVMARIDILQEQMALNHVEVSTHMEEGNRKFEKIDRYLQKLGVTADDINKSVL